MSGARTLSEQRAALIAAAAHDAGRPVVASPALRARERALLGVGWVLRGPVYVVGRRGTRRAASSRGRFGLRGAVARRASAMAPRPALALGRRRRARDDEAARLSASGEAARTRRGERRDSLERGATSGKFACYAISGPRDRLAEVRERSRRRSARGGHGQTVTIVARDEDVRAGGAAAAWEAGLRDVGENKVQEALAKMPDVAVPVRWHLIGHLQRNKAKQIDGFAARSTRWTARGSPMRSPRTGSRAVARWTCWCR